MEQPNENKYIRNHQDLLANDDDWPLSHFKGCPARTVCRAAVWITAQHQMEPYVLPVAMQMLTTLGFSATVTFRWELARPFGVKPVHPEPNCASCVGHIAMKARSHDENAYVSRIHSINSQIICDARMRLLNIVARWPGSFILTNSMMGNWLQADGWLFGE